MNTRENNGKEQEERGTVVSIACYKMHGTKMWIVQNVLWRCVLCMAYVEVTGGNSGLFGESAFPILLRCLRGDVSACGRKSSISD